MALFGAPIEYPDHAILACRAALATLDLFERDEVIAANRQKSALFTDILAEVMTHPEARHARHLGMIWAFDVPAATPGFASRFHQAALAQGAFVRPIGQTVYVMPPYVTTANEMRHLARALAAGLRKPVIAP